MAWEEAAGAGRAQRRGTRWGSTGEELPPASPPGPRGQSPGLWRRVDTLLWPGRLVPRQAPPTVLSDFLSPGAQLGHQGHLRRPPHAGAAPALIAAGRTPTGQPCRRRDCKAQDKPSTTRLARTSPPQASSSVTVRSLAGPSPPQPFARGMPPGTPRGERPRLWPVLREPRGPQSSARGLRLLPGEGVGEGGVPSRAVWCPLDRLSCAVRLHCCKSGFCCRPSTSQPRSVACDGARRPKPPAEVWPRGGGRRHRVGRPRSPAALSQRPSRAVAGHPGAGGGTRLSTVPGEHAAAPAGVDPVSAPSVAQRGGQSLSATLSPGHSHPVRACREETAGRARWTPVCSAGLNSRRFAKAASLPNKRFGEITALG